jgi:outer membrane protein OmpA-like peptidoglycan-associated protein
VTPAVVAAPPPVKTPQVAAAAPKAPPPPPDTAAASPDDHPPPPTLPPPVVPSVDTPPPADIPPPSPVSGKQGLAGAAGLPAVQEAKLSATAAPSVINALPDGGATILFGKDGANLPGDAIAALTRLAGLMKADDSLQVGLLAYADGDEDNASKARRLSLTRGLAVRSFLIDQGIRNTRIVVRALGNKVPAGPADRVDIQVQKH